MIVLMIVLFWVVFVVSVVFTVFLSTFPDRVVMILTIVTTPVLAFSFGYVFDCQLGGLGVRESLAESELQTERELRAVRFLPRILHIITPYLIGVVLAVIFVYLERIPPHYRMGYCGLLGFFALAMVTIHSHLRRGVTRFRDSGTSVSGEPYIPLSVESWVVRGVWILFVIAVAGALIVGRMESSVLAISIVLFGTLMLYFTQLTAIYLVAGHPVAVESNWGGLGAGMGGWRVSRPLVFMLLALFFGLLTFALIRHSASVPTAVTMTSESGTETRQAAKQDEGAIAADSQAADDSARETEQGDNNRAEK